jgi:hypothetical protein
LHLVEAAIDFESDEHNAITCDEFELVFPEGNSSSFGRFLLVAVRFILPSFLFHRVKLQLGASV